MFANAIFSGAQAFRGDSLMVGLFQNSIETLVADSQRESFDAIVVGGGTSGLAVAATLFRLDAEWR